MSKSPNRAFGLALGIILLVFGIGGFFITSSTGFASTSGPRIIDLFETNPLHNLGIVVAAAALLVCGLVGPRTARAANGIVGALFALLGVVGLIILIGDGSALNILALNGPDTVLSFAIAVVLLAVSVGADRAAPAIKAA